MCKQVTIEFKNVVIEGCVQAGSDGGVCTSR